jgi:hypothetical protein
MRRLPTSGYDYARRAGWHDALEHEHRKSEAGDTTKAG